MKLTTIIRAQTLFVVTLLLIVPGAVFGAMLVLGFFEDPTYYQTGKHPLDIVVGDVNDDGLLDVLTANRDGRSISIFMGNGDGTFTDLNAIESDLGPSSLALGDMDGDGQTDIVAGLCNVGCTDNGIGVFRGLGDGRFETAAFVSVEGVPYNITLADFDGDQQLDVAASDYPGGRIIVLLSRDELGVFDELYLTTGQKPIALLADDLNNDGLFDLISSDHGEGSSSVYLNNGRGGFSERLVVETGNLPYAISLAFFDDDDVLDLLVAHSTPQGSISVLLGDGDGGFTLRQNIVVDDPLLFIDLADFNRDGLLDVLVTRNQERYASVFLNTGSGYIDQVGIDVSAENKIYSLRIAELNDDKFPDLITVEYEQNVMSVALGRELE